LEVNMSNIKEIIPFLFELRKMHLTYRATPQADGRFENDAEHSWSVAMSAVLVCPYLEEEFGVKIDREKVLIMSLIHDLAEIKTGDTKTWDEKARVNKAEKEEMAINELLLTLPEKMSVYLKELWTECENQETIEAKIVKSLDRVDPVIHRTATKLGWQNIEDEHQTMESVNHRQLPRHEFSKVLTDLFVEIRNIAEKEGLFLKK